MRRAELEAVHFPQMRILLMFQQPFHMTLNLNQGNCLHSQLFTVSDKFRRFLMGILWVAAAGERFPSDAAVKLKNDAVKTAPPEEFQP